MSQPRNSYPLRLAPEVQEQARRLAAQQDRSLNWMLNELVKRGIEAAKENAPTAATAGAPI